MRAKIYYLSVRQMLHILKMCVCKELPDWLVLIKAANIPEGATAHWAFLSPERQAFGIVVSHESFDEVGEYEQIPDAHHPLECTTHHIRVIKPAHDASYSGFIVDWSRFTDEELLAEVQKRGCLLHDNVQSCLNDG